jgi:hypothetical protein
MADSGHSAQEAACIVDCLECYSLCRQHAASRLMEDCAEICRATADFMLRGSAHSAALRAVCAKICEDCAESCADAPRLADCARACRGCAQSCRALT